MAAASWSRHVADGLRRNDIRMLASVPADIGSHVLEHLGANPPVPRRHRDTRGGGRRPPVGA